jgi:signal transduction histidine kinase
MEREGEKHSERVPDVLQRVYEQTRHYAFHNDQMLRGPLFRVKGMLQLFQRESWPAGQQKLLEIVQAEVDQMEQSSNTMARMLEEHEAHLQRLIDKREQL